MSLPLITSVYNGCQITASDAAIGNAGKGTWFLSQNGAVFVTPDIDA